MGAEAPDARNQREQKLRVPGWVREAKKAFADNRHHYISNSFQISRWELLI